MCPARHGTGLNKLSFREIVWHQSPFVSLWNRLEILRGRLHGGLSTVVKISLGFKSARIAIFHETQSYFPYPLFRETTFARLKVWQSGGKEFREKLVVNDFENQRESGSAESRMFSIRIVSKGKETIHNNKVKGIPCPFPPLEHGLTRKANGAQNGDRKLLERKFERQNREKKFNRIESSTYVLRLAGLYRATWLAWKPPREQERRKNLSRIRESLGEKFWN